MNVTETVSRHRAVDEQIQSLADSLFRERIRRARSESAEEKLLAGPRLFEQVVERMKDGLRHEFPTADEQEIVVLLQRRLRRLRQVEEHGIYARLEEKS